MDECQWWLPSNRIERACPVCGSSSSERTLSPERIVPQALDRFAFASRKLPEFMSWKLVICAECSLAYAPSIPRPELLAHAYSQASFNTSEEEVYAAGTYIEALRGYLQMLPVNGGALEIGAGSGAFLKELQAFGFSPLLGLEPSEAAIKAASPSVRDALRHATFTKGSCETGTMRLICTFQTLEHVPDPTLITAAAYDALVPGGVLAVVCHDYRGLLNRLLGVRSPIIDIQHLQLFNKASLRTLLVRNGFEVMSVSTLRNQYPLSYWLRLTPAPASAKAVLNRALALRKLDRVTFRLSVGNLLAVGRKGFGPKDGDRLYHYKN
jgi:SAM-dependent methyltransferase